MQSNKNTPAPATKEKIRILLLEHEKKDVLAIKQVLQKAQPACILRSVATKTDFLKALKSFHPTLILSNYQFPRFTADDMYQALGKQVSSIPFIIVSQPLSVSVVQRCLKKGIDDYVPKTELPRLPDVIIKVLNKRTPVAKPVNALSAPVSGSTTGTGENDYYKIFFEMGGDAIVVSDSKGNNIEANNEATRLTGYSRGELLSMTVGDVVEGDSDENNRRFAMYYKTLQTKKRLTIVNSRLRRKNGTMFWCEISAVYLPNATIMTSIRNVDDRQKSDELLKKSEEIFKGLTEHTSAAIIILQKNRTLYVNTTTEHLTGYTRQEHVRMNFITLVHPDFKEAIRELELLQADDTNLPRRFPLTIITKKGEERRLDVTVGAFRYEGEFAVNLSAYDVTKRMQIEEKLLEQRSFLKQVIDLNPNFIFAKDRQGRFTLANQAVADAYGTTVDGLLGKTDADFNASKAEVEHFLRDDLEVMDTQREKFIPLEQITDARGKVRWLQTMKRPIVSGEGNVNQVLGVAMDVTERITAEQALHDSEEKFRTLAEQSPNMIFINKRGRVVYANKKCEEVMGYTKEEFLSPSFNFLNLIAPESIELIKTSFAKHSRGEDVAPYDYTLLTKSGKKIESIITTSLMNYEGETSILGIVTDITERKRAEEALRENETRYRLIVSGIEEIIYRVRFDGDVLRGNVEFVTNQIEQILGYTPEDFKNPEDWLSYIHPDDVSTINDSTEKIFNSRYVGTRKYRFRHKKTGEYRWMEDKIVPLFDDEGKVTGFQGVSRDITDRKDVEEKLNKLSLAIEQTADSIIITDSNGIIEYINPSFEKLSGYTFPEVVGKTPSFLKSGVHPQTFYEKLWRTISQGKPFGSVFTNRNKNGEFYYTEKTITPIKNTHGVITNYISTERNITERIIAEKALRESEERFRSLFEESKDVVYMSTPEGKFVAINNAGIELFGYASKEEFLAMDIVRDLYVQPEERYEVRRLLETQGFVKDYEFTARTKDGRELIIQETAMSVRDERNKIIGFRGILRDITERKHTEEALRRSEEKYRYIITMAQLGIYQAGVDGTIYTANTTLAWILGYHSEQELLGRNTGTDIYWNASERGLLVSMHKSNEAITNMEVLWKKKDGSPVWIQLTSHVIKDKDGSVRYYEGYVQDITERKRSDEKIEEQAALLNVAQDAIFVLDLNDHVLFWNNGSERLYGWHVEELTGIQCSTALYKDIPAIQHEARRFVLDQGTWRGELTQRTKNGGTVIVESHWTLVRDNNGNPKSILVVNNDITERKKLETQLMRAQRMESIGTLAGGIAHDFNNILGIIIGYTSLLERQKDNPERFTHNIEAINKVVQRAAGLVKQMLTFARKSDIQLESANVNSLVDELRKLLVETFPKTISYSLQLDARTPIIVADTNQLHQTLLNLCVNARDAMPNGGELRIETKIVPREDVQRRFPEAKEKEYVRVSVSDTGTGMDETTKNRIFEPFFTTKGPGKGTGLGLSVVYGIMRNHNGFIDVESEQDKGTAFYLYFAKQVSGIQQAETDDIVEKAQGGTETVLVVEDEEMLRELIRTLLEDQGYSVLEAKDGLEAVQIYQQHKEKIAVILTDMGLPKLGGAEVFLSVKQINPKVKVILASGYLEPNLKSELLKAGAKDFVQKPYHQTEILKKIREIIEG